MRYPILPLCTAALALTALAACHAPASQMPGDRHDHQPWHGIAASETIRFIGTEPFWSGEVTGSTLVYRTPENESGQRAEITRFAGRGGVSFSGSLTTGSATPLTLAITPDDCSDGMSDRRYPFAATLQIGGETRQGCAWTDRQPARDDNTRP